MWRTPIGLTPGPRLAVTTIAAAVAAWAMSPYAAGPVEVIASPFFAARGDPAIEPAAPPILALARHEGVPGCPGCPVGYEVCVVLWPSPSP